jgi:uncharacterized membrane protein YraQ (UPF0718 family)
MTKENIIKITMVFAFLLLFLLGSRFKAEHNKIECSEGLCQRPHEHGELNFHERFPVQPSDTRIMAVIKSSANFWEANATGMTFAIIIGAAALSLALSYTGFSRMLEHKGIKGAAIGSIIGMPLNMCANCSAVTSVGMTARSGSAEASLGVILGGALLNFIGIVTMFGIFHPAVVISRIVFSVLMILVVVPLVSKLIAPEAEKPTMRSTAFNVISCYFPEKSFTQTMLKALEDWLLAVGNIAYKLIPLMLLGTVFTAIIRVIFPNEFLHHLTVYNSFWIITIISFIGTLLSIPVLFEILLGTILMHLGFSDGAVAAMVFTAPSFGIFTLLLTREKLGGFIVPLILIAVTFIFGIGAGLLTDVLTKIL